MSIVQFGMYTLTGLFAEAAFVMVITGMFYVMSKMQKKSADLSY